MKKTEKITQSETAEVMRSEIHLAGYNPRILSEEARKALKRGIKKFGLAGGIVVNRQTGMTVVGGHQRLTVMDEIMKYDAKTGANDYKVKVEIVDMDEKKEKELNLLLNNHNAQGSWDYDKLREMMPDIDYMDAGFTEADLQMIGVDFMMESDGEREIIGELNELYDNIGSPDGEEKEEDGSEAGRGVTDGGSTENPEEGSSRRREMTDEERKQHMKDVKREVSMQGVEKVKDMESYFMVSFENYENKAVFMESLGFDPLEKFIKGEVLYDIMFGDVDEDEDSEDE